MDHMVISIVNYVLYGFPPGSCTQFIIENDRVRAKNSMHPILKENFDIVYDKIRQAVPEFLGDKINFKGIANNNEQMVLLKLWLSTVPEYVKNVYEGEIGG